MNNNVTAIWLLGAMLGLILMALSIDKIGADKQTLLSVIGEMNEEIAIRDSYINDLCTAIDSDSDNFRVSCRDIKGANDYGRGRITP